MQAGSTDSINEDMKAEEAVSARQAAAVREVAQGKQTTPEEQSDALDWFLSDDPTEVEQTIRLNVGGPVDEDGNATNPKNPPKWVEWVFRPLDLDTIKQIRKTAVSAGSRAKRRGQAGAVGGGEFDENLFNLGVVVEATVYPDVRAGAMKKGIADPRIAVKQRFASKAGLIGQIVSEVLDLSGYNENDVQDGDLAASAAGNSPA